MKHCFFFFENDRKAKKQNKSGVKPRDDIDPRG